MLLKLAGSDYRLSYTVQRSLQYWPHTNVATRIRRLLEQFRRILNALCADVEGIQLVLPDPDKVSSLASLKKIEDAIDALVCCWAGIAFVEGRAKAYGDADAAIWVPG